MNNYHTPVLLKEIIDLLQVKSGKQYIDATIGGGGHTKALLEKGAKILGIDADEDAQDFVKNRLKTEITDGKLVLAKGNFSDIGEIAHLNSFG
jgi:16S rRNA (cytosine1402-N4)-methyltransferase